MLRLAAMALLVSSGLAQAEILIGVAGPFSGQYQNFAAQTLNGVQRAVDELNAQGGLNGEILSLTTADDQCETRKAEEAAQKLIAQKVDVVIGHFCSASALAAAKQYEAAGISLIAPSASLPSLTQQSLKNVIRLASRSDAQGAFAARRILEKRPNAKLALLDDGTAQMKATSSSFATAYGKAIDVQISYKADQKDFTPQIAALKSANIDTVYLATSALDAGRFLQQAQAVGLDLKRYGPDSLLTEQFWEAAGTSGENTLVSFPSDPEKSFRNKNLLDALKVMGETSEGPTLPSYAAVQLFAQAAKDRGPHSGLAIVVYLKSGEAIATNLGPYRFDQNGDGLDLRFTWFSWNNGTFQAILDKSP